MDTKLYSLISRAREATAGSNILPKEQLIQLIKEALQYTIDKGVEKDIKEELYQAYILITKIQDYGDRLLPDTMLCDILNEMDKEG